MAKIYTSGYHTIFIANNGIIKAVGRNTEGELGLGNKINQSTIQTLAIELLNIKDIICGSQSTIFLMEDGTVKGFGYNNYGQLGLNNTTTPQLTIQNSSLTNVKQISSNGLSTIFLMNDGTVKSVGDNEFGQLGLGNNTNNSTIQTISGLMGVKEIAIGYAHTMFLMEDGTVKSVGYNNAGQLGLGNTTSPQLTIQSIPSLTGVKHISCGRMYTIFLMEDGTVKVVGDNTYGQLGLGNTTTPQLTIQTIPGLTGVKQISCGFYHTVFLMNDGTVKSVGNNTYGQLGLGHNTSPQSTVQTIPNLTEVNEIKCGKNNNTIFILNNGSFKVVGDNTYGQLGLGNTTTPQIAISSIDMSYFKSVNWLALNPSNGHYISLLNLSDLGIPLDDISIKNLFETYGNQDLSCLFDIINEQTVLNQLPIPFRLKALEN